MHNYRHNSKYSNMTNISKNNIDPFRDKDELLQQDNNKQLHYKSIKQKIDNNQQYITISISSQQYTSLHIKHLGNHSMWKKTTVENRYNDSRLHFINPKYFINKYVLDIGCNEGFLSMEIAMRCFPKQIYAIDIDNKLIKNAKRTLYNIIKRNVNYQQIVNAEGEKQKEEKPNYSENNKVENNQQKQALCKDIHNLPLFFQDRLKNAFTIDHYLPDNIKLFTQQTDNRFPLNIKFQSQNIYTIKYHQDKLYYDTILCLKITKWIHLTLGDNGIRRLFQKIYDLLRLDGILILQAQDWASYKRKKNMYPLYRQNYDRICYGPNEFQSILVNDPMRDFKFELVHKIDQNQRRNKNDRKLDYPILIFRKKSTMLYY